MYFDIVQTQEPDENGNVITRFEPVTVCPGYPDITPKDMSLSNQMKAGLTPQRSGMMPVGDKLSAADAATSQLFENGENLIPVETPVSKPSKKQETIVDTSTVTETKTE